MSLQTTKVYYDMLGFRSVDRLAQDWVQVLACTFISFWCFFLLAGLIASAHLCISHDCEKAGKALFQGAARQLPGLLFSVLLAVSAWGTSRRAGWFYEPFC